MTRFYWKNRRIWLLSVLFFLGFFFALHQLNSQSVIMSESFESDGHGSRYTVYPRVPTGTDSYPGSADGGFYDGSGDYVMRVNNTELGSSFGHAPSGMDGSRYLAFEDTDDNGHPKIGGVDVATIQFDDLNISGYTDLKFSFRIATPRTDKFDNGLGTKNNWDSVSVFYRIDAATEWTKFAYLTGNDLADGANGALQDDSNLDGTPDGEVIGTGTNCVFETLTKNISGTGSLIDILMVVDVNGGSEELALDLLVLSGTAGATAPDINIKQSATNIASGGNHDFGSVQIGDSKDVVFTVENTGDGDLDITSITPAGTGFSIQSAISADPISASGSATFTVRFQPTATSQTSGSVTIISDDSDETNYVINFTASVTDATISIKVFLEGPLSGTSMSTSLGANLPKDPNDVYSGVQVEAAVANLPTGTVDWVEVELRTGTAAGTKVGTNRAGILKSDGTIVDKDGNAFTMSQADGSSYYIIIHHRNHLSVMSSTVVMPGSGTYSYDFTTAQAQSYSNTADGAIMVGSVYAMISGDSDDDGDVDATDLTTWRGHNGSAFNYDSNGKSDLNLDGVINAVDRNEYQQRNDGKSSQVPNS